MFKGVGARQIRRWALLMSIVLAAVVVIRQGLDLYTRRFAFHPLSPSATTQPSLHLSSFQTKILDELHREVQAGIRYQDGYFDGGEPPATIGVCSDVVNRSLRLAGIDLQQALFDDIQADPHRYGIEKPDRNIDHRRCRNLILYFQRHAKQLPSSGMRCDWQPGDIVFWSTHRDERVDHVGMVADHLDARGDPTIIHHWPGLPVCETDGLYRFPIAGHFRWPAIKTSSARGHQEHERTE